MSTKELIELIAAAVMPLSLIGVFILRFRLKKGIGLRAIQFMGVTLLMPVVLILSLEQALHGETIAALLGAVAGYTLSGIGEDEQTS